MTMQHRSTVQRDYMQPLCVFAIGGLRSTTIQTWDDCPRRSLKAHKMKDLIKNRLVINSHNQLYAR